jgi:hypothetical protein
MSRLGHGGEIPAIFKAIQERINALEKPRKMVTVFLGNSMGRGEM